MSTNTQQPPLKPITETSPSAINKFIIDGKVKHMDQQALEPNIDAFVEQFGQNKFNMVYVNGPNGETQPIPIADVKGALSMGYTLMDDTADFLPKNKPETKPEASAPQTTSNQGVHIPTPGEAAVARTIGANTRNQIGNTFGALNQDSRNMMQQAAEIVQSLPQVPRIPGQTDIEYAEQVAAATNNVMEQELEKQQKQLQDLALPTTRAEIDKQLNEIDGELATLGQQRYGKLDANPAYGNPMLMGIDMNAHRRAELYSENKERIDELQRQRAALESQASFLNAIEKYNEYDRKGDKSGISNFFRAIKVGGDLQALASFGLTKMQEDLGFAQILERAHKGETLTLDEKKALQMYTNMKELAAMDRGAHFNAGLGMQQTFEFMRDIALVGMTGGASTGNLIAQYGVKGAVKQLGKNAVKKAGEAYLKTALTPSFYKNLTSAMVDNYDLNYYGGDTFGADKKRSGLSLLYRTWAETGAEYFTESISGLIGNIGIAKRIAKTARGNGMLSKAMRTFDEIHDRTKQNPIGGKILEGLSKIGVGNIPEELLEEIAVVPLQSITLGENRMGQLLDPRFYQEVLISTAAIGGMNSATNILVGGTTAAIEKRKTNNKIKEIRTSLDESLHGSNEAVQSAYDRFISNLENENFYDEEGVFAPESILDDLQALRNATNNDEAVMSQAEEYAKYHIFKQGQTEALKAIAEEELGSIEYGNSASVVLFHDKADGSTYHVLGETKDVVVLGTNDKSIPDGKLVVPRSSLNGDVSEPIPISEYVTDYFIHKPTPTKVETLDDVSEIRQQGTTASEPVISPEEPAPSADGKWHFGGAANPKKGYVINVGDTAAYGESVVKVVDIYENDDKKLEATIEDENGEQHIVSFDDLAPVVHQDNSTKTRYILPDGRRAVVQSSNGDNVTLGVLDDNNQVVEEIPSTMEEVLALDKVQAEEAEVIETAAAEMAAGGTETAQIGTETAQIGTETAPSGTDDLPRDKDGNIDYDTLLAQSPTQFVEQMRSDFGTEVADVQLGKMVGNIDNKITELSEKVDKETSPNKVASMLREIQTLQGQRDAISAALAPAQQPVTTQESVPAAPAQAPEQIAPDANNIASDATVKDTTGSHIRLSDEIDENGRQFVLSPNGTVSFGDITDITGLTPAPILLSEGLITNPASNDGYGLVHIEARHGKQIRDAGYKSVVDFIDFVAKNYEKIRLGKDRDGNQTYMLQLPDEHNNTLMIELSGDGTYWNINTAGIFKKAYGAKNKVVYDRHTTEKQSVETAEASQIAEQSDTQTTSSMNAPTTTDHKDTTISETSNIPGLIPIDYADIVTKREQIRHQDKSRYREIPNIYRIEEIMFDYFRAGQADQRYVEEFNDLVKDTILSSLAIPIKTETKPSNNQTETKPKPKKTILEEAQDTVASAEINAAAQKTDTKPSEAQKEAGNYKKGHIIIQGLNISIEQPKGSTRSGKDPNGKKWSVKMNNHYGYIRGTKGKDKDHIDVFIGDSPTSKKVFVVDQVGRDGSFDEHKVMIGFDTLEEAKAAYLSNYEEGWQGLGAITETSMDGFKEWIGDGTTKTRRFAEYKASLPEVLRQRVKAWEKKLGVKVNVYTSVDEIPESQTSERQAIEDGVVVTGWINRGTDENGNEVINDIGIYLPNISSVSGIDATYIHEVVSHYGLKGLLGEEGYNQLCDKVWEEMSEQEKNKYLSYPGVNGDARKAADEYIANLAEILNMESLSDDNRSIWDKIASWVKNIFSKNEEKEENFEVAIDKTDLSTLLRASYARLAKNRKSHNKITYTTTGDISYRASNFFDGMSQDELTDVLNDTTEYYAGGPYRLISALEQHYGGELTEVSSGGRHALEQGLIPFPGDKYSGKDEEYHHIAFKNNDGDTSIEAVPFDTPESVRSRMPEVMFRFIGEQGATNLDRAEESTIRMDNLSVAREMEAAGKDALNIKMATGWERGADKKWRYEVEDNIDFDSPVDRLEMLKEEYASVVRDKDKIIRLLNMYPTKGRTEQQKEQIKQLDKKHKSLIAKTDALLNTIHEAERELSGMSLEELIGEDNNLFKEYPQLVDINVSFIRNSRFGNYKGFYSPSENTIWISPDNGQPASTLVHELQHAIQHIEGFARGGNTSTGNELRDKAKAWSWKKQLEQTEKEHPELAGSIRLQATLEDEYKADDMEDKMPSKEIRTTGFNLYVRGYDNEGYESAYDQWEKIGLIDNPKDYSTYKRLAGEVEARNVQTRKWMPASVRREALAVDTEYDVAREDQIFIMEGLAAMSLEENVGPVDINKGDVMFAAKDVLTGNLREQAIKDLMAVTGRSMKTVNQWLKAEESLAQVILHQDNVAFLDLQVDESVPSIWKNSDYPQGTVEFSNICKKRLPFTTLYQRLQQEFPNTVFDAETLNTIRETMKNMGEDVACALCFVEDRRQLLGEIGQGFIDAVKGKKNSGDKINENQEAALQKLRDSGDKYIPTLYDILTLDGMKNLRKKHPAVAKAFVEYNNARGMQSGRLFQAYSAYNREILGYSDKKVKSINDNGGLRIFSFSDFEAHHLIDLVQVLTDCAAKGIKVQGYTKVPEFAKAVKDTGAKINRSLIAKGKGYVYESYIPRKGEAVSPNVIDGKRLLFDTIEGIDVNHPDFFDSIDSPSVGNILVAINDEHARLAMQDPFVDYIIGFHSGQAKKILAGKGIGDWVNYKDVQLDKVATIDKNGKQKLKNAPNHGLNIYTDILNAAEAEGKPIKTAKQFTERFLAECDKRGYIPRFYPFLNTDEAGKYVYTPGYHKFLLDFKMFDKNGKILPQKPVLPIFDNEFNKQILDRYVQGVKEQSPNEEIYQAVKDAIGLGSETQTSFRAVTDPAVIEELEKSPKRTGYRNVVLNKDGSFSSPMAFWLQSTEGGADTRIDTAKFEMGKWEEAEEHPDLVDEQGHITLVKPNKKTVDVAYDPYIHNRLDPVNLQFKEAWNRDNLVYIETEVAETDLNSGYHADKALLPTGVHSWSNGDLMLSRYDKPVRVMPWEDVADAWAERLNGEGVHFDVVPSAMRSLLVERGVEILPPHKGMGKACNKAYSEWMKENEKSTNNINYRVRSEEERENLFAAAKEQYGVTNNFNISGYMLPDGSLLNFEDEDGDRNLRGIDHRNISSIINDREYNSRYDYVIDFLNEGAIRIIPESNGINLQTAPTAEQRKRLLDYFYKKDGYIILEIDDANGNSVAYMEYDERTSPYRIMSDIDNYFNDGIIPQQNTSFRVANQNQAVFVSNAARAVEGINMGKASPEQWLKTIEKSGGLKAGEDKWMGLSDWLKDSDKKSLTKEEVLDFINEHMVQIEEQHYLEDIDYDVEDQKQIDAMNEEFLALRGEAEEAGEWIHDAAEIAYMQMADKYGDDFTIGFGVDNGKLYVANIEAASTITGIAPRPERLIDGTRLNYTTNGLDNNHEIALIVPTIKSWDRTDVLHFGDAGDGRAIAWIRFGDTKLTEVVNTDYQPKNNVEKEIKDYIEMGMNRWGYPLEECIGYAYNQITDAPSEAVGWTEEAVNNVAKGMRGKTIETGKVLVIDEIQSNRHQEGRKMGYTQSEIQPLLDEQRRIQEEWVAHQNELKEKFNAAKDKGERYEFTKEDLETREVLEAKLDDIEARITEYIAKVPDAPFEKNWHELAMKRMLRYAAENGYDKIAWTKGEQQAERYDISSVVGEINATKFPRGYEVVSFGKHGRIVHDEVFADVNAMAAVYGKEMAQRIIESVDAIEPSETATISGDNLRVGGESMKSFYDKMLPSFMNKYGKKWGVKVEDIFLPNLESNGITMHSIDVTPKMKESVMQGQVMFRAAGLESLVERTYRKDGSFSFSGKNRVETIDDVAFIFKQLEDSAIENAFLVFIKDGKPTILHVGMGDIRSSVIDQSVVLPAYKDFGADMVYMVHNHPSGRLVASRADIEMLSVVQKQLPNTPVEGIIINTTSGNYAVIDYPNNKIKSIPEDQESVELDVLSFSKNVFSPDYKSTIADRTINDPESIAAYLSAHRLGKGSKVGALLLNNSNIINGNLVTNDNEVSIKNAKNLAYEIAEAANRCSATSVVLFGDFDYSDKAIAELQKQIPIVSGKSVTMLDVVRLNGRHTQSLHDQTLPSRSTLSDGVSFRTIPTTTAEDIDKNGFHSYLSEKDYDRMKKEILKGSPILRMSFYTPDEYISSVIDKLTQQSPSDATEALQMASSVRDAFTRAGIVLDMSDNEIIYALWKEVNPSDAVTIKEKLEHNHKSNDVRYRIDSSIGPNTNDIKLTRGEQFRENWVDKMVTVKMFQDLVKKRGGSVDDNLNPYITENLSLGRQQRENELFQENIYRPMVEQVTAIEKLFVKEGLASKDEAYKAVNDFLYARHAPERNRHVVIGEIEDYITRAITPAEMKFISGDNPRAEIRALATRIYNIYAAKSPDLAEQFAKNMLITSYKSKDLNERLKEFRNKFIDTVKGAKEYTEKVFNSKRGTNRSGMSDKEAREIIDKYYVKSTQAELDKLSDLVRESTHFTLDTWYKYNMISAKERDNYKSMYKYYIPLRNWEVSEDIDYSELTNQAFNHASEIISTNKKARGRSSRADNPLAYIASLAQSAIVLGNKNQVRLNMYRLVLKNLNILGDIATIPKVYFVKNNATGEITQTTERPEQELFDQGLVETKTNKDYLWHKTGAEYQAHLIPVIINGDRHLIEMRGEFGVKIASAINNTNSVHLSYLDATRPVTQWLSATRTSYNPEFIPTNFARDFMFGNMAYAIEGGNILKLDRNLGRAFRAINRSELGTKYKDQYDRYYEEFMNEGAQTGFMNMRNIETMKKDLEKMHKQMLRAGGKLSDMKNFAIKFGSTGIQYLNAMSENAMRFAVYLTEREKGASAKQAAFAAKEITVNFNRKGRYTENMGALYSFFNASVQGTARLYDLTKKHGKRTAVALATLTAIKLTSDLVCALVAGDDYDELSDYVKFSNILIPIGVQEDGRTRFLKIPMAQGVRAVTNIADVTVDVIRGTKTVGEAAKTFFLNNLGEHLPLSFEAIDLTGRDNMASFVTPFLPSVAVPFFEAWRNTDFKGDPIYREDFTLGSKEYLPRYTRAYNSTNPVYVELSRGLNALAGGNDELTSAIKMDENGNISRRWYGYAFDINPAIVEHIVDGFMGGITTFPSNTIKTITSAVSDEKEVELYNVPIVNRFVSVPSYKEGYDLYFRTSDLVRDIKASEKAVKAVGDMDAYRAIRSNRFNAEITRTHKIYDDRVKRLRKSMENPKISTEQKKKYEEKLDNLMKEASAKFEKIYNKYDNNIERYEED